MSWADSNDSDSGIEIGDIRCQYCGKIFLEEVARKNHERSCKPTDDGDESGHDGGPRDDNEEFDEIREWLQRETENGPVRFQARSIADDVGLTNNQIGNFMGSLKLDDESGYDVEKLSYTDRTRWEVSQA